jgi:hypothetical protein
MYVFLPSMVNFKLYIYVWTMQIKEPYKSFIPVYKIWAPSLMIIAIYLQFIISTRFSYKYVNTKIHLSINLLFKLHLSNQCYTEVRNKTRINEAERQWRCYQSIFKLNYCNLDKYVMLHRLTLITSYCETCVRGLLCKICKQGEHMFLLLDLDN